MTEREYILEMLCCTPMELLEARLENKDSEIPRWLVGIPKNLVEEAVKSYHEDNYAKKRDAMLRCMGLSM